MSYTPARGRLRKGTAGADRSQAASSCWGIDPVKEIGQTCGLNVIVRRNATSDRRMVTAAKYVCSTWNFNQPGERHGKAIYRNRFAPRPVHLLLAAGERPDLLEWVEAGGGGEVCEETAAGRRSGRGD